MHDLIITRVQSQHYIAIIQNQQLKHFYLEDNSHQSIVGNIYYGTVVRVIAGTQSAFVDIGQERTAFLHLKDCYGADSDAKISQILSQGQNLIVQVLKDPIVGKGARLSTEITVPSTYLVYQPYGDRNGVSQKIVAMEERERIHEWFRSVSAKGLIARTVAQGVSEEELEKDWHYVQSVWKEIHASVIKDQTKRCLWKDFPLPLRILRDFSKMVFGKIFVNSEQDYQDIQIFMQKYFPEQKYELIKELGKKTVFSKLKIGTQFLSAMKPQVPLKSGGSVIIEQTESMVTIDVNTSGFTGKKSARETILKTNLEAVDEIAHQIPLRELGGLIIIDFIDMALEEDSVAVYQALSAKFKEDLMPTHILPMSSVGLIQMTRKRTTESSVQKYFQACPCCHLRAGILAPYVLGIKFLEQLEDVPFMPQKTLVISARQDLLSFIRNQEDKWKAHSGLQDMPWKYSPIAGYHSQMSLALYDSIEES